jgi:ATP-dependent Clp protease ATP-binding subunit ClpB
MSKFEFTDRAQASLVNASELAQQYAHPQILPIHLALSLFEPPPDLSKDQQNGPPPDESLFKTVINKAHGDAQAFERSVKKSLVRQVSQDPPPQETPISPSLSKVLRQANEMRGAQKDSFIAIDHLIQGKCSSHNHTCLISYN